METMPADSSVADRMEATAVCKVAEAALFIGGVAG